MTSREVEERLGDILDAIARIEAHTAVTRDGDPAAADLYRDAVHYQLIVIGEAIAALPDDVKDRDPDIPWRAILGLRNRLAHEYFQIDPAVIRQVVDRDLAELSRRIRGLIGPSGDGDARIGG